MSDGSDLVFVALGGAGEIGMNMYLYGHGQGAKRRWIMVDCGVGFGDMETSPGIELVMADPSFIAEQADKLVGIFATHAHEDHIGALGRLWPRLKAPIHARPFTGLHIRRKLEEAGVDPACLNIVQVGETIEAGPFKVSFQPVTHSIPEASSLVIDTPSGRVVHTGDFKFDDNPQIGAPFDLEAFRAIGSTGVQAMICDSTNVFLNGHGGSESEVVKPLADLIRTAKGAVAATTFASNVARLRSIAVAAEQCGRAVVLVGRAMERMVAAAVETGELRDFPRTISDHEAKDVPQEHVLYLATGSQGEGRAALARIASGSHPTVRLGKGDMVIFSSKTIPGNEQGVAKLANQLSERGVHVVDEASPELTGRIHVSGHARKEDLRVLYEALKPRMAVPMHGEHRHLVEHSAFAATMQVPAIPAPNGTMVAIGGDRPVILNEVPVGRLYLDGDTLIGAMDGVVRSRLKLARQGHVVCALVVDEKGELLADPEIRVMGGPLQNDRWPAPLEAMIYEAVDEAVEGLPKRRRADKDVEEVAARAVRAVCGRRWGKRPVVTVIVTRLEDD
ncbi:ribonuclease J [uncultured Albimonas sp.]|uniref:ribonuclease J n=1 Tax=uncultured Albimonas sp. TaxID=1331701 RepID=UPI0030EBEB46